jgi:NADH-quinone oxidoreductase subunit G
MADSISLTIDGQRVSVAKGTNLVDAAQSVGISIPVFCYHPRLSTVGMCRMCLVSIGIPRIDRATGKMETDEEGKPVIAILPKLQTACTTFVSEGMVVYTQTDEVKAAQRGILEFLLTSHPLDCPVCDKGGECPLQNLTMQWGPSVSRYSYDEKVHFDKPIALGPLIYLDRERCILCSRCVRFQDDIADDQVLGFSSRGRGWHIISKSDPPFDSKFSGNTTDVCPVGALTTRDFRFRARVWELKPVPSICTHCSVGCNITLDMRLGQINRIMPRENAAVNDLWICDKGRFAQRYIESKQRLTTPMVRRGDRLVEASWGEALKLIGEKLGAIAQRRTSGESGIAGLAGGHLSNEDFYLFQRLFREVFKSNHLDHRIGAPGEHQLDDLGVQLGVGKGTSLLAAGKGTTALVIAADPEEEAPIYMQRLRGIARRGGELIVANARPTKLDRSADYTLHYKAGMEQHLLQAIMSCIFREANIQRLPARTSYNQQELRALIKTPIGTYAKNTGVKEDVIQAVARSLLQADDVIIVYGAEALVLGSAFVQSIVNLLIMIGKVGRVQSGLLPILPAGNTRGAMDMGIRPDYGPGYPHLYTTTTLSGKAKLIAPLQGLSAREMWGAAAEGRIRAMYIAGLDPVRLHPATKEAIEKLEFLVVQDMFITPTAELADVVLPVAASTEREGTYTNAERRVQRARKACNAPGECRPDWAIFQAVARSVQAEIGDSDEEMEGGQRAKAKGKRRRSGASGAGDSHHHTTPAPWDYLDASDIAYEIAERVHPYEGITYATLANVPTVAWGRGSTESVYYDGTSYKNMESIGIQYATPSERPDAIFTIRTQQVESLPSEKRYPFILMVEKLLYDSDPLLHNSLVQECVPQPYAVLHPQDATQLQVQDGDTVRITSPVGTLEVAARVASRTPAGSVLVGAHLAGAPLAQIQTGARTRVSVEKG